MRTLTPEQDQLYSLRRTRQTWIIEMDFADGVEFLSTNGDITVDGQLYTGSDLGISNISDWTSAKINLLNTASRTQAIIDGGWQGNTCKVYSVPTALYRQLWEEGYAEESYAIQGFVQEAPILVLDGVLTDGQDNLDHVSLTVTHKAFAGQVFPPIRATTQYFNHLPEQGSQFEFDGYIYTMETV